MTHPKNIPQKPLTVPILATIATVFYSVGVSLTFNSEYVRYLLRIGSSVATGFIVLGIVGTSCAFLTLFGGIMWRVRPDPNNRWGKVIVVCAFLSFFGAAAGLLVGFAVGLSAGIAAFRMNSRGSG